MLRIAQGRVYDPANGIDGEVRDVCLDGGKVVEELPSHAPRIDASGMVVMPGGVDIHSHIAGPAVNAARKLTPEEHRGRRARSHGDHAFGHGRDGAVDVRDGLPLRAPRLYDRRRRGHPAARGAPHARRAARHADRRQGLPRADGQQPVAVRAHPRGRPRDRGRRLVARGHRRLRRQAGQPGRGRDVEARQPQRHGAGRRGGGAGRHAAPRAGGDRRLGGRAGSSAPRPRPLQQPRGCGQLAHHARHARHPAGPAGAPRPPPVPRVRRDAGQAAPLARAGAGRAPRRTPGAQRRHRPGDVRARDDDDRRRARLRACCARSPAASG